MGKHCRLGRLVFVVLLLVTGCTKAYNHYPGPPRAASEIAVITPGQNVRIHALDDKVVNVRPGNPNGLYVANTRIHARPGEYTLTVIPQGIKTVKTFTRVKVKVEAGKRYRVRSQFYPGSREERGYYKFWVDNEKTGAIVSEVVESRNPFQPKE